MGGKAARVTKVARIERFVCGECHGILAEVTRRNPTPLGVRQLTFGTACAQHADVAQTARAGFVPPASTWVRASEKEYDRAKAIVVERTQRRLEADPGDVAEADAELVARLSVDILIGEERGYLPAHIHAAVDVATLVVRSVKGRVR